MLFNNYGLHHRQLSGVLSPVLAPVPSSTNDPLIPLSIPSLPSISDPFSHPSSSTTAGSQPSSSVISSRSLTSSTSSSSTSTSSSSSSSSPTPTPTPISSVQTLPGGSTTIVVVQESPTTVPVLAKPSSFLNNKAAEGVVFALVGVAVLIIIFLIATFMMRRKRRRDIDDILSFDPAAVDARTNSMEKFSSHISGGRDIRR